MTKIERKLKQKLNIKRLFIDATMTIIKDEGLEAVNIRKVAKITGYNSATLYLYFKNLDHLIFLASLKFLKDYTTGLDAYTTKAKNSLEESILIWEFFCKSSFKIPKIYKFIFFSNLDVNTTDFENYHEVKEFYEIYPEDIITSVTRFNSMLLKLDIYKRSEVSIVKMAHENFISPSDITTINEILVLIYKGLLDEATKPENFDKNEILCDKAIKYIKKCYKLFVTQECRLLK